MYYASDQQIEMWDHAQKVSTEFWNFLVHKAIDGNVDLDILKESLKTILKNNSGLRTTFTKKGSILYQIIHDNLKVEQVLTVLRIKAGSKTSFNNFIRSYTEKKLKFRFNYETDYLFKISLVYFNNKSYIILLINHIICDYESIKIFWKELISTYNQLYSGNLPTLMNKRQYFQYSSEISNEKVTPEFEYYINYWKEKIENINKQFNWPLKSESRNTIISSHEVSLDQEKITALKLLTFKNRVIYSSSLLTAYFLLIHIYSNQKKITIFNIFNFRDTGIKINKQTFGLFADTLLNNIEISDDDTILMLLKKVDLEIRESFENGKVPFRQIFNQYQTLFNCTYPYFQADFNYIKLNDHPEKFGDLNTFKDKDDIISKKFFEMFNLRQYSLINATNSLDMISDVSLSIKEESDNATIKIALLNNNKTKCIEMTETFIAIINFSIANPNNSIKELVHNLSIIK